MLAPTLASAFELEWSGFGTVGFAQSNRDYAYERFIDRGGTFERDSVFGLQADARLNAQWSATLQLKASPAVDSDNRWAVQPAWAMVSWRPSDDWLLRAGRLRLPLYLHSESLDVGVTHDMARLPTEMYSISPTSDINGLFVTKTWVRNTGELTADIYTGQVGTSGRFWTRDGVPGSVPPGPAFVDVTVKITGGLLTWRGPGNVWRAGLVQSNTRRDDGQPLPVSYPFVPVGPGMGYYQVDPTLPGPGGPVTSARLRNDVLTLGVEEQLRGGWRVAAEFARNFQRDTQVGADTRGGYVALFKNVGHVTYYGSAGVMKSSREQRDWYRRLTGNPLPGAMPGAAEINAAQRMAAATIYASEQKSFALGAAWSLAAQQKLKAEWKRTRIGEVSRMVDTPPGTETPNHTHIDIVSLSYNFAF